VPLALPVYLSSSREDLLMELDVPTANANANANANADRGSSDQDDEDANNKWILAGVALFLSDPQLIKYQVSNYTFRPPSHTHTHAHAHTSF